jgi:hypothetical protein
MLVLPGDFAVGQKVGGKYEIEEVLGRGSNGTTYKVHPSTAVIDSLLLINFDTLAESGNS